MAANLILAAVCLASVSQILAASLGRSQLGRVLREPRSSEGPGPNPYVVGVVIFLLLIAVAANFSPGVTTPPPVTESARDIAWVAVAGGAVRLSAIVCVAVVGGGGLSSLGVRPSDVSRDIRVGVQAAAAVFLPTLVLSLLSTAQNHPLIDTLRTDPSPLVLLGLFLSACVLAPLSEELAFRGLVQNMLSRRIKAEAAIVLTAMLFLGVHPPGTIAALIPAAFGFGYVYHQTQSLVASASMHAAFNGLVLLISTASAVG